MTLWENIPTELKIRQQWVVWKLEHWTGEPKPKKMPYDPKNISSFASTVDPNTWGSFESALIILQSGLGFSGIGYVFSKNDPYIGIDFDNCIDNNGDLDKTALLNIVLLDSYTEISQSGKGLHIIGRGENPDPTNKGHKNGDIEYYTQNRYFAITGDIFGFKNKLMDISQSVLVPFYKKYFPEQQPTPQKVVVKPIKSTDLTDDQIIEHCRNAKNSSKFNSLWNGSTTGYNSSSEADLALCSILGFYTNDENQIQRLLQSSGLNRKKLERSDYIPRLVHKVLTSGSEKYGENRRFLKQSLHSQCRILGISEIGKSNDDLVAEINKKLKEKGL